MALKNIQGRSELGASCMSQKTNYYSQKENFTELQFQEDTSTRKLTEKFHPNNTGAISLKILITSVNEQVIRNNFGFHTFSSTDSFGDKMRRR